MNWDCGIQRQLTFTEKASSLCKPPCIICLVDPGGRFFISHYQRWNPLVESLGNWPKVLEAKWESCLRGSGWACHATLYCVPAVGDRSRLSFFLCGVGQRHTSVLQTWGHWKTEDAYQKLTTGKHYASVLFKACNIHHQPPGHPSINCPFKS